jgi:hypothetical protein
VIVEIFVWHVICPATKTYNRIPELWKVYVAKNVEEVGGDNVIGIEIGGDDSGWIDNAFAGEHSAEP